MTPRLTATLLPALFLLLSPRVEAAISWDGEGGSNWWFDPQNWSQDAFGYLPPAQDSSGSLVRTDAQINDGSGPWDVTGEGVVYDPDNDPFYAAATTLTYPTGSSIPDLAGGDYGPQHLYRLYVSRNTTNSNLITIKSGDLFIESTTIIGRSGSSTGSQNLGQIDQWGGSVNLPVTSLEIGNSETSGWGNGVYRYLGGTLSVSSEGGSGIRLAHGRSSGPSGVNRLVIGNGEAGYIRTGAGLSGSADFQSVSYRGSSDGVFTEGQDANGVDRGVAYLEYLFENGGTRAMQVAADAVINNGFDSSTGATLSSRLVLTLNEAPAVDLSGVPVDLGLIDVNFDVGFGDNGGVVRGFGDIDNDGSADAVFASEDGATYYTEGSTVSAMFGGTRYDWSISYTGDITWADADNSVIASIGGPESGGDIVLIGLGSEVVDAGIPGDFDGDGDVDIIDFGTFADNFGMTGLPLDPPTDGDFEPDGDVDIIDFGVFADNFGTGVGGAAAVPEPSTLACLLASLAVTAIRRRN